MFKFLTIQDRVSFCFFVFFMSLKLKRCEGLRVSQKLLRRNKDRLIWFVDQRNQIIRYLLDKGYPAEPGNKSIDAIWIDDKDLYLI